MKGHALVRTLALLLAAGSLTAGCGGRKEGVEYNYPRTSSRVNLEADPSERETILGEGGLNRILNQKLGTEDGSNGGNAGIGVNSFLWRAALDTIAFMPLSSADPFGGVIITDWYSPPEATGERFKLNVFILGRSLRSDGIQVTSFRQVKDLSGNWVDAPHDPALSSKLEETILTRARQLRMAAQAP